MKVAIYARFGNKVESKLTEQEQKEAMQRIAEKSHHIQPRVEPIPSPEELKTKGYEVMTLPKKKAWLFMRTSKGMSNGERTARLDILRQNAKEHGYDIVGETVIVGNSRQAKMDLKHLLEYYLKDKPADTVFMRGLRDMSFKFGEIAEMCNMIKNAGLELKTADGSDQALDTNTEHGMKWRGMFAFIAKLQDDESMKQPEGEKDEPNENPTHIIGGM